MDSTLIDRIHGVIYGHAVGDALGLGAESLSKHNISMYYPDGLTHYSQIVQDFHRLHWPVGAWTDDTGQMLCILDSLVEKRTVDVLDIAYRLHYWATHGGMGIGKTVYSVLNSPGFLWDPHSAAKKVWCYSCFKGFELFRVHALCHAVVKGRNKGVKGPGVQGLK